MSELGEAPTSELSEFRAHARRIRYSVIQSVDGPRRRFLAPQAPGRWLENEAAAANAADI